MDIEDSDLAIVAVLGGAAWRYRRRRRRRRRLHEFMQQYHGYRYRPPFNYPHSKFDLDSLLEENQLRLFQFNASKIRLLADLLQLDLVP